MRAKTLIHAKDSRAALERLVASAESELCLALQRANPSTPLTDPRLLERGMETWADLIGFVARRDVTIHMMIPEPDPLFAISRHRKAWAQASGFANVMHQNAQVICASHVHRGASFWRFLVNRQVRAAINELRKEDPSRLTPTQRSILKNGARLRPAEIVQSMAIADGKTAILGDLTLKTNDEEDVRQTILLTDDPDFCASLHAHFGDCWNRAVEDDAYSLAARASLFDNKRRGQSRQDLRVLRTISRPQNGTSKLLPEPSSFDYEIAVHRMIEDAKRYVFIETPALRDPALAERLSKVATFNPELQLILVLPRTLPPEVSTRDWSLSQADAMQSQVLSQLAAIYGDRFALLSVPGFDPHRTTVICDDEVSVIAPSGLTPRSLRVDTSAAAYIENKAHNTALFDTVASYWLDKALDENDTRLASTWNAAAAFDDSALPTERKTRILPYPAHRSAPRRMWINSLQDDLF